MAKGEPKASVKKQLEGFKAFKASWNDEFCAEHDGTIASFARLKMRTDDLANYGDVFKRESTNMAKVSRYVGYTAVGVLSTGVIAVTAGSGAPALAVALGKMGLLGAAGTGTAISTLSGAALTSASLAAIGGSVATGTAVVSAVGLGLGGITGGALAHKYHGDDPSFSIRMVRSNSGANAIFVNGFTQEKESTFNDWSSTHHRLFPDEQLYGVTWSSKSLSDLGKMFAKGTGNPALKQLLTRVAEQASKQAGKRLGPFAVLALLADLGGNPWHVAMANAGRTGSMLADAIIRSEQKEFTLVGHSLGARVIYYALQALSTRSDVKVQDVILLGAAVGRDDREGWQRAQGAINGTIFNCYSSQDDVLKYLYTFANLGFSDPAGRRPITYHGRKIKNVDCSDFVESHMKWKNHYGRILEDLYPA